MDVEEAMRILEKTHSHSIDCQGGTGTSHPTTHRIAEEQEVEGANAEHFI